MRLVRVRVSKFRNFVDSGEVVFDDDLTCLVGLNEAGKTSLLQALLRLKPHDGSDLRVQDDYPRWLWKRDERSEEIEGHPAVSAVFSLDREDLAAIAEVVGEGVVTAKEISVQRKYLVAGLSIDVAINYKKAVETLLAGAELADATLQALKDAASGTDLKKKAAALDDEQYPDAKKVVAAVDALGGSFLAAVKKVVADRMPTFFYFDNYAMLPGRVDIADLMSEGEAVASSGLETARSLLRLANTSPEDLVSDEYEDRKAELEAVSADLTDEVFEYWQQNVNLRVQFDVDKRVLNRQPHQTTIVQHWLDIRVENLEHRYSSNFDRRSHGFQWFFSFLAAFTEFERQHADQNFVVLLDEPGLSLHGLAQRDLLRFVNDRLSGAVQVIYTTHSPFMVETDHIERVRIVEDKGKNVGASVTQEVMGVDDKSLFPLQTALGYDASQHLFVGTHNVAVEGPSDVLYLTIISRRLEAVGKSGLDEKWSILPTGGASNLPAFVALLGSKVDVTVVMDSGTEGGGRIQAAMDAGRIKQNRLIRVGEILSQTHADLEDLFAVTEYLELFNEAFGASLTEADLGPGDRVVKRIEAAHGKFDHYRPADVLLRSPERVDALGDDTLERFAALMDKINKSRRR